MSRYRFLTVAAAVSLFISPLFAESAPTLMITPTTFDFGWAPANAKITAEFKIKNTGIDMIPITSVQPTCGCTASNFSPSSLASNEETTVTLTFNTRGYDGAAFSKATKVKTAEGGTEYTVTLAGHVTNPNALVVPDSDGVAGFVPKSKDKKKINLQNKGPQAVSLTVVQKPAPWAKVKLQSESIPAGGSTALEISVDDVNKTQDTSITFAVNDGATNNSRVTIAIRSGEAPPPPRIPANGKPVPSGPKVPGK